MMMSPKSMTSSKVSISGSTSRPNASTWKVCDVIDYIIDDSLALGTSQRFVKSFGLLAHKKAHNLCKWWRHISVDDVKILLKTWSPICSNYSRSFENFTRRNDQMFADDVTPISGSFSISTTFVLFCKSRWIEEMSLFPWQSVWSQSSWLICS